MKLSSTSSVPCILRTIRPLAGALAAVLLLAGGAEAASVSYVYDNAGRVVSVKYSGGQRIIYAYDDAGNITQMVVQGSAGALPAVNSLLLGSNPNGGAAQSVLQD
ncbi:RHS repeat domain-containing protein [Fundidesulfovibrio soli]|uniref:RHS repeat domain-containing protein n=1 Tax=Fundidesulfovibrio soli TaxID=2922716 RepID=UPI001FAF2DBB|nr:RHS repeat domain-containing protein [Fundidesulfovibrio soli]